MGLPEAFYDRVVEVAGLKREDVWIGTGVVGGGNSSSSSSSSSSNGSNSENCNGGKGRVAMAEPANVASISNGFVAQVSLASGQSWR